MNNLLASIEAADIAIAKATAPFERTPPGRLVGKLGELGDQPPMRALCAALIVTGVWGEDRQLAATGVRMLAAHTLATCIKTVIKDQVDRTRPSLLVEHGEYEARIGDGDEHDRTSFPSGHTAGVVAVAVAYAGSYPQQRSWALGVAAFMALIQIPRRAHFASDVAAGAAIGLVGAAAIETIWRSPTVDIAPGAQR